MRRLLAVIIMLCGICPNGALAAEEPRIRMPADAPDDIKLGTRLLRSPNPETRAQAASWIGSYGDEAKPALPDLVKLLNDPSHVSPTPGPGPYGPTSPSDTAYYALMQMGDVAVPELLTALKDPAPGLAPAAARMLGYMFRAKARNEAADPRCAAIAALGRTKSPEALQPLLDELKSPDTFTRHCAMEALADLATPEALLGVLSMLNDTDARIREDAARRLGRCKDRRAVEGLIGLLRDADDSVLASAIYALTEMGDKRAIKPLKELASSQRPSMASIATGALIKLADRSQCEPLVQALTGDGSKVLASCAEAISAASDPTVIDAAIDAIDSNRNVDLAISALKKSRGDRVVRAMIGLLSSDNRDRARDAAHYLGEGKHPTAVDALIAALDTDEPLRIGDLAFALQAAGDRRATPALLKALPRTAGYARSQVLRALAASGVGPDAERPLILTLDDKDASNRWLAAGLLGDISTETSASALIALLKDDNPGVRSKAAESLGAIGTAPAADALTVELMSPDSLIRPDAALALGKIGGPRVESYLKAALTDNSQAVRRMATAALDADRAAKPDTRLLRFGDWCQPPAMHLFAKPWLPPVADKPQPLARLLALLRAPEKPNSYKPVTTASRATLAALIRALAADDQRLAEAAAYALRDATTLDYGHDALRWSKWLAENDELQ